MAVNNVELELIKTLKKEYSFNYYDFFKSIFEREIPLYLKLIALKGSAKNLCKRKD